MGWGICVGRNLPNFVDGFLRYTEGRGSPSIYRKWTAIFLIGAVLERKAWMITAKGKWFANQYINLVGPAGVGKSLCTSIAYNLMNDIRTPESPIHIAPTSVTKASLIDRLDKAERRIVRLHDTPPITSFNSLTVIASELGVFLPAWDGDFMSTLTDLWDNGRYEETRRTRDLHINIPNAQLNLLTATTPAYLNALLPEGAWEFGFMSRVINIYSGESAYTDIFAELDMDNSAYKVLAADLKDIYGIFGEFKVTDEAKIAINRWGSTGGPPRPDHPKLTHYVTRRMAHLLKLCIIASAATDSERIITLDHYAEALDWMVEAETFMPDIFKALKVGGDARAIEECWHFAYQYFMKHKQPVPEHMIIMFLQERVPAHSIKPILDAMVRGQLLTVKMLNSGGNGYEPKTRQA
jgi:hypothetical protein